MSRTVDKSVSQAEAPVLARRVEDNGMATVPTVEVPVSAILAHAVDKGMPPDVLEKIVGLFNQQEDRKAAREFAAALAAFQSECPVVSKSSTGDILTKSGAKFSFNYADLGEIGATIRPYLHKHGLSYSWDSAEDKETVTSICTLRHANGHSVSSRRRVPVDSVGAAMSGAQNSDKALTTAMRRSLAMVMGLVTGEPDDDSVRHRPPPVADGPKISADQAANIDALLDEVTGRDADRRAGFLEYMGVRAIADIPASAHKRAIDTLEKKRREQGGKE